MAMFRHHISLGAIVATVGVILIFFYSLLVDPLRLAIYFAIGSFGSILPDFDSDSGLPFYLTFGLATLVFAGGVLYLTLIDKPENIYVLVGVPLIALVGFWWFVGGVVKHCTHHRGIWHSVPMLAIASLVTYVIGFILHENPHVAFLYGASMAAGFLSHLVLDEVWSEVDSDGNPFTHKRSQGTALKFLSQSSGVNLLTYLILIALVFVALNPEALSAFLA